MLRKPKAVYPGGLTQREFAIVQARAWQQAHLDRETSEEYQVIVGLLETFSDAELTAAIAKGPK